MVATTNKSSRTTLLCTLITTLINANTDKITNTKIITTLMAKPIKTQMTKSTTFLKLFWSLIRLQAPLDKLVKMTTKNHKLKKLKQPLQSQQLQSQHENTANNPNNHLKYNQGILRSRSNKPRVFQLNPTITITKSGSHPRFSTYTPKRRRL